MTWIRGLLVCKYPKDRFVGLLPNGRTPWLITGGSLY